MSFANAAAVCLAVITMTTTLPCRANDNPSQDASQRLEVALDNILSLHRPGEDGYAAVWDGNKYIQCQATVDRTLRCEAAGTLMQPSLKNVLAPSRVAELAAQGWRIDGSFGNFVQVFPAGMPIDRVAKTILTALDRGYGADLSDLAVSSNWIASEPCPPRNGASQNLAGLVNDSPAMAATAVHACAFDPDDVSFPVAHSSEELVAIYGGRASGEIQRLRVNIDRHVFLVMDTDGGYVQCAPQSQPDAIYCEAQSPESWPVLARILTPDRLARLHEEGFADPGRAPNFWRIYPLDEFGDVEIAKRLLTILFDVYGYTGDPKLQFATESGD